MTVRTLKELAAQAMIGQREINHPQLPMDLVEYLYTLAMNTSPKVLLEETSRLFADYGRFYDTFVERADEQVELDAELAAEFLPALERMELQYSQTRHGLQAAINAASAAPTSDWRSYTIDQLQNALDQSDSIGDVVRRLRAGLSGV